ncbi:MAG: hypothetical protein OEW15_06615 [Nitrospirota bacterium]|nr:hypothetical protein [Nitrospirota bacterium]
MTVYHEGLKRLFNPISLSRVTLTWILNILFFCASVFLNAMLGYILGLVISWMFCKPISVGLALFGFQIPIIGIHKVGAVFGLTIGFIAPFYRFAPLIRIKEW